MFRVKYIKELVIEDRLEIGTFGIYYISFKDDLWILGRSHLKDSISDSDTEAALGLGVDVE
ncbi:MAG: hypothetical protein EA391_15055 [Balneolaceae bacterium]|nr:MAG: hypothetical protein EA391_15055 [Balneolaceae bacterium]